MSSLSDINTLVNDRRGDTSAATMNMTAEGFRAVNGTLEIWQILHDWPWTVEKQTIDYNAGINRYVLDSDFKAVQDLRYNKPSSGSAQEFAYLSPKNFDSNTIETRKYAVETENQAKILRLKAAGNSAQIHTLTQYDSDGTWVAASDASNISTDSYEFFSLGGSVNFDYSGTSGTITNSTMSQKDLRRYVDRGNVYVSVYLPTVTNFTSIAVRVGSGASAYYTATATTDYLTNTPVVGWNTFKFNVWGTTVGSPDTENIDYVQFIFTYDSSTTDTDFRLENMFVSENTPVDLYYYSLNMVLDTDGTTKRQVFDDSSETDDTFLWTTEYDYVKEVFINSTLETILWMTGEYEDRQIAINNIQKLITPLKQQMPTRRAWVETRITI